MRSVAVLTSEGMRASKRILIGVALAVMIAVAAVSLGASRARPAVDRSGASWGGKMVVVDVELDGASWS